MTAQRKTQAKCVGKIDLSFCFSMSIAETTAGYGDKNRSFIFNCLMKKNIERARFDIRDMKARFQQ